MVEFLPRGIQIRLCLMLATTISSAAKEFDLSILKVIKRETKIMSLFRFQKGALKDHNFALNTPT